MTILDNVLARFGYSKAQPQPPSELMALAGGYKWDMPGAMDAEKQARLYAQLTWISTAIDRVAEIGATGIYSVKKTGALEDTDADDEDIPNHPFELLLRRPNPSQSRGEFLRDALSWRLMTGRLYLFLNKASEFAPPDEMWIIPSQMMKPLPDGQSFIRGYEFTPHGGTPMFVEPWKIMHLKSFNPLNPFEGLSAVQSLALDAYGDIEQQKWNLALFGKNNGKFPGILAFKYMVDDPAWARLKQERDEEWGGTNRPGVTMLRGVGDTIQYLPAAMSQREMEFLAGRGFTKEEIYGKLAPGLASILAVNATEANAIAGKSTLIEFGVWPLLDQLAQKFSSDVLPLYGDNLVGEFDDLRQTNRILDLQEQAEYAKYHTVNEVRAEYYGDEPLELDDSIMAEMEAQDAEAAAPASLPPQFGKAAPVSKLDPRGFLFPAQIGPSTPAPGAKPAAPVAQTPPMMQQPGDAMPPQAQPDNGQPADQAAQADELAKWEKFALARAGKGGREFEPRVLPLMKATRIAAGLKAAGADKSEIVAVFKREREEPSLLDVGRQLTAAIEKATAALG